MAESSYPGVNRRQDDRYRIYKIKRHEHYLLLSEESRLSIVKSIQKKDCQNLANELLTDVEKDAALNRQDVQYPAAEILEIWQHKPHSTIWILKDTLKKLNLTNALECLKTARLANVTLYIAIFRADEEPQKHTRIVPGLTPLLEIIRPLVHRHFPGLVTVQKGMVLVLRLRRVSDCERITWYSPAKDFKGQQVDITLDCKKYQPVGRPHTYDDSKPKERARVERNVISWIEEDSLCFEFENLDAQLNRKNPADVRERLAFAVQESAGGAKQDVSEKMDDLSLITDRVQIDPGRQGQENLTDSGTSGQGMDLLTGESNTEVSDSYT